MCREKVEVPFTTCTAANGDIKKGKAMELKEKVRVGLDENRMLVLVVQVLVGFDYRAIFEPGFEKLPVILQYFKLGSLGAQLFSLALLLTIPSYHRLVERGENTANLCQVIRRFITWSLVPFAFSIGAEFAVPGYKLFGMTGSVCLAVGAGVLAFAFWDVFPRLSRSKQGDKRMNKSESLSLTDQIKQVLTESRVVLPGTQALLGFDLITFLSPSFDRLPSQLQMAHLFALSSTALSAILLMTPPAYHRIALHGENSEGFVRLASGFVLAAMAFLALGLAVDFYVVLAKVTQSSVWSSALSVTSFITLAGFWFVYPFAARSRRSG
jgi:hypothetical protein